MSLPDRLPDQPEGFEANSGDERPDWLVGAEEGVQSELQQRDALLEGNAPAGRALPIPGLTRPVAPDLPEGTIAHEAQRSPTRIGLPIESRQSVMAPAPPKAAAAWTAAGNSVPRLMQTPEAAVRNPFAARETGDEDESDHEPMPDDDNGLLSVGSPAIAPRRPRPALAEPWWMVMGERIASDRRILIGIGTVLVVAIAGYMFWPRENATVSVRDILKNPDQWEGRSVKVGGRVGDDVFPLGQGYVFHLLQGRDTIVVFTRSRNPERKQRVSVVGEVSAGYLDGRARLAILETPGTTP